MLRAAFTRRTVVSARPMHGMTKLWRRLPRQTRRMPNAKDYMRGYLIKVKKVGRAWRVKREAVKAMLEAEGAER